jgi:hypothetical protein
VRINPLFIIARTAGFAEAAARPITPAAPPALTAVLKDIITAA